MITELQYDETNINHLTTEVVVNGFYINGAEDKKIAFIMYLRYFCFLFLFFIFIFIFIFGSGFLLPS